MTRCLNCGADRDADLCEACGLTSNAAEFALRKTLLNRTAIFVLGALAAVAAATHFPPLELDGILIFVGVLFFLTLVLAILVERRALRHLEVEALKRIYFGLVPVTWILAGLIWVNGAFDKAPPQMQEARVEGKFSMGGALPSRRLVVTSWRSGHHIERIPVDRVNFNTFDKGDIAEIKVQGGLVGIPWIADVYHR